MYSLLTTRAPARHAIAQTITPRTFGIAGVAEDLSESTCRPERYGRRGRGYRPGFAVEDVCALTGDGVINGNRIKGVVGKVIRSTAV